MRDQRRLARANLAGDDNEAFTLIEAIAQIALSLTMARAFEVELRVGGQLKGPSAQSVICVIHGVFIPDQKS